MGAACAADRLSRRAGLRRRHRAAGADGADRRALAEADRQRHHGPVQRHRHGGAAALRARFARHRHRQGVRRGRRLRADRHHLRLPVLHAAIHRDPRLLHRPGQRPRRQADLVGFDVLLLHRADVDRLRRDHADHRHGAQPDRDRAGDGRDVRRLPGGAARQPLRPRPPAAVTRRRHPILYRVAWLRRNRCSLLLVWLSVLILANPVFSTTRFGAKSLAIGLLIMLMLAVWALRVPRTQRLAVFALATATAVAAILSPGEHHWLRPVFVGLAAVLIGAVTVALLRYVLNWHLITIDKV